MKINSSICSILCTLAIALACLHFCRDCKPILQPEVQTVTKVVYDTIQVHISQPVLKDSVVIRYTEVRVPYVDTIHQHIDTISVSLPVSQKVYEDSLYRVWVSGYQSNLDSIHIFQPTRIITHTITKTETQYKSNRWGLGVQVGMGMTPNKVEPFIGIGISYNIFSW